MGQAAKAAAFDLAVAPTAQKNRALAIIADELEANKEAILAANARDISAAVDAGISDAMQDRLLLTEERLVGIANDVRNVIGLNDPVGSEIDSKMLENGMSLSRRHYTYWCYWCDLRSPSKRDDRYCFVMLENW